MDKVILKLRPYIQELFKRRTLPSLKYHNLAHTERVVERSIEISKSYTEPIGQKEIHCLVIAAWFHDTGHLFNELKDHEQAGVDLMAAFLKAFSIDDSTIDEIGRCIMATKWPANPQTESERILCDADTYHFGTKEFLETDTRIYAEQEERLHIHIENKTQKTIHLLESHRFYTGYCRHLLENGKKENLAHFRRLQNS